MCNNNDIFNRIFQKASPYGLAFISSNGGTGKTTFFKFRFLRDAVKNNIPFHIFCRYSNQMEITASTFLLSKPSYSKRQNKLLNKCEVQKDGDKFIYIVEAETGRKLAQVVNIFGQSYYKPFGNTIGAKRALFDEILAENGEYCPDEINKFNRLVFTMARGDEYHVVGLYNNTTPNFDYFSYYGGKSYNTHVSDSGAIFIYFKANQFSRENSEPDKKSIQAIIKNTLYNDVYSNNTFVQFPVFHRADDLKNSRTFFKLEIENRIFKIREKDGYLFLQSCKPFKKSKKKTYSVNSPSRTEIKQLPLNLRIFLAKYKQIARLKTDDINNTIFVKILCEKV